jgi:hypothetical protein
MSNNYNYNNYYNQNNFHNRNKNFQKKKNIFSKNGNIREIEINSISQTEPTEKYQNIINKKSDNEINQIDQYDNISKTNDETLSITNFKQEFTGTNTDDIIFRDFVTSQVKTLVSKLDDFDFEKKLNEISNKINDVKISLENKIEDYYKQNEEDIMEIKELFNWQSINDLRVKLSNLKGEKYTKNFVIYNVFDFEKYYDSILSYDLKEKFFKNKISFSEIINLIYNELNEKKEIIIESLNDKFWFIINSFSQKQFEENKLIINISGNVYRIIKHFRGLSDDIIIDFGEIISFLNKKEKIDSAKNTINIIINVIYEILNKQIELSELSNKIFAYGHIYYGKKSNNVEIKEFYENSIFYDFIELN